MERLTAILLTMLACALAAFAAVPSAAAQDGQPPAPAAAQPTAPPGQQPTPTPWIIIITKPTREPPGHRRVPSQTYKKGNGNPASPVGMSAQAIPANDAQTLADIDALWLQLWPILVDRQIEYYTDITRRKYMQALWSHSTPPSGGDNQYPDLWFTSPSDQQYRWSDSEMLNFEPMPYALKIDTYVSPEGPGFVACRRINLSGGLYEACEQYGPLSLLAHPWQVVTNE